MSTQQYVSGPAYLYTGTGASAAYEFVGFSERGFTFSFNGLFEDTYTDYSAMMPADVWYGGQDVTFNGMLSRYDETVFQKILSRMPGNPVGGGLNKMLGTLLMWEGYSYQTMVHCPYATKTLPGGNNLAFPNMQKVFVFPHAYLSGSCEVSVSIRVKRPTVSFRAIPSFGTWVGNQFNPETPPFDAFQLYHNTPPNQMPTPT